jgi:outer membrane autotransporter protein
MMARQEGIKSTKTISSAAWRFANNVHRGKQVTRIEDSISKNLPSAKTSQAIKAGHARRRKTGVGRLFLSPIAIAVLGTIFMLPQVGWAADAAGGNPNGINGGFGGKGNGNGGGGGDDSNNGNTNNGFAGGNGVGGQGGASHTGFPGGIGGPAGQSNPGTDVDLIGTAVGSIGNVGTADPGGFSAGGGGGGGAGVYSTGNSISMHAGSAADGGAGGNGGTDNSGSGGGGGGGAGVVSTINGTVINSDGAMTGGTGGTGGDGLPGGGGGGGDGLLVTGGAVVLTNGVDGSIRGGNGGDGGASFGGPTGDGGSGAGGAGIDLTAGGNVINNSGSILGGLGGVLSGNPAFIGLGGAGIITFGNDTINNDGAIFAGASGTGVAADAILFNGTGNRLNLMAGTINGNLELSNGAGATIAAQVNGQTFTNDIALGSASALSFDTSAADLTVSSIISGTGTLTAAGGSGTLILTGTNTYTGITTVNSGSTLQVGIGTTIGTLGAADVVDNGILNIKHSNIVTMANAISGSGELTQSGGGTLILTGDNSYGATTISAGTLQVGNGGATGTLGTGSVTDNTALRFDRSGTLTVPGDIGGTGTVTQNGSGTVILTGANNYSGATIISTGVLQIGDGGTTGSLGTGAVSVNAGAFLNFDRSDTLTVANLIDGAGTLNKNGDGNLILTGNNSFSGNTNINAGTLSLASGASLVGSPITVNSGGTLSGNGTAGTVSVMSGGVLAPANTTGALTINGGLSFDVGAMYRVQADAAGNADRVNVIGNTILNGTVDVQAGAGAYAANTTYTILTNTGTQTNTFAGVTSNLAFLTPTLSYDANDVYLNLVRNTTNFADVAVTRNQRAAAGALDASSMGASGDMNTVLTAITGLSAGQARASFDAVSGAGLVAMRRAGPAFATNFGNQLQARLNAVGAAASASASAASFNGIQLAANDHIDDLMPALAQTQAQGQAAQQQFTLGGDGTAQTAADTRGFWLRGYGSDQSTDGDGNAASNRNREAGMSVGVDTKVNDSLVIGAALTHGSADIDTDNNEDGRSGGNAVALYASYASGAWNVNGSATLSRNDNSMQRRITFGSIDRTANSHFDSNTVALYGDVTYDLPMAGWTLQPLAGLSLSRNKSDVFTETGADALDLQVAGQTVNSTKTLFGAKAIVDVNKVQLQPRLIWSHEFGNANSAMTAQLQGAPTPAPFAIAGVDLPRDALIAGMTLVGHASERLALFADVQGEFNSQQTNLALLVGLRASW